MEELTHDEYQDLYDNGEVSTLSHGSVLVLARSEFNVNSYGEQWEQDAWMVIRQGTDSQAYKKYGWADSYGNVSWDGLLKAVSPTIKTIEVWE